MKARMNTALRRTPLLVAAFVFAGCGAQPSDGGDAQSEGQLSSETTTAPANIELEVAPGFSDDLQRALGATPEAGQVYMPSTIQTLYGFGVEYISVWGRVSAGAFRTEGSPLTIHVLGAERSAMDVTVRGDAAKRLYDAMKGVPTITAQGSNERSSPEHRVTCYEITDSITTCTIRSVVGFNTR